MEWSRQERIFGRHYTFSDPFFAQLSGSLLLQLSIIATEIMFLTHRPVEKSNGENGACH